ncbi:MAG TPA: protein-disulfide reductase DsbD domain-containing protein [Verrucomicrobiae bacterium]|jgi:thiol:disulfide interchange protein DsbD|nr:protein-disulfide reductase DsbD domain-containing protein [Verrucomicrobiae bacterium]
MTASVANRWWRIALLFAASLAWPALAAPKTHTHLILSAETARPGDTIWAGLEMDMPPTWHVYWRYGGDAGDPVKIKWTLPDGVSAGEINWPVPEKEVDKAGDVALVTYIYTHKVVLLTPIKLADSLRPGPVTLTAAVHWMECSQECVMVEGTNEVTLNIGAETKPSADAALIEQWRKKIPPPAQADAATAQWQSSQVVSNSRPVVIEWKTGATPADFYPYADAKFSVEGTTEILPTNSGAIRLRKMLTKNDDAGWPDHLTGILVSHADSPQAQAVEVALAINPPPAAEKKSAPPIAAGVLATMLGFAFLGGLILNIMPCVLPVIALKILSFVKQSGEKPGRVRNLGLVYGLGVLVSFLILAALAIGVQQAGGLANWGDLFRRHPNVQLALTVLVTLIALNLFGLFEITLSSRATGAASELASRQGFPGAFFNGALATILATPCTAPFLGVALAFALAQSATVIVLFFLTVGIGFAFPFVLLCAQPRWMGWLPKPGAWMEKFKIAMGFPMLATAFWLLWLSANDESAVLWLGLFLVVLALAAWMWGEFVQRATRRQALAAVLCLVLVVLDYSFVLGGHSSQIVWQPWSPQAVEAAQRAGHPVLVDFTAKSCLTCQLNKATGLEIDSTRAKLQQIGAVAFVADYTRDDPAIGEVLRHYDRAGVPLVLVYSKDVTKRPEVLPTFPLTPSDVLKALDEAAH